MRTLESDQNHKFKVWKRLKSSRGRKKEDAFLVESQKLVAEALFSSLEAESLIFRKSDALSAQEKLADHLKKRTSSDQNALDPLFHRAFVLPDFLFAQLSQMESSDGVLAVFRNRLSRPFSEKKDKKIKGKGLLLDHIQDPGNAGAILRSAEAFGFGPILLVDTVDIENEKCLRASMGAAFRLDLFTLSAEEALTLKSQLSIPWYGAHMEGEDYRTMELADSFLLLIGNEGQGLRPSFQKKADKMLRIPMKKPVESLNAAVSASILMATFSHLPLEGKQKGL